MTMKSKIHFVVLTAAFLFLAAFPAFAENIPVKIGPHGDYTRIVFEFPRLLAYHVNTDGEDILIDFDTKDTADIPARKYPLIRSIKAISGSDGALSVDIKTADGASFKHYRMQRKVVIDILAPGKPKEILPKVAKSSTPAKTPASLPPSEKKPEDKKQTDKKEITPEQMKSAVANLATQLSKDEKELEKPAAAETKPPAAVEVKQAPAKQEPAPEALPPKEPLAKVATASPLPPAPAPAPAAPAAAPVPAVSSLPSLSEPPAESDDESPPDKVTTITFSFLEPTRFAVFDRFDTLWVVTDSSARGTPPVVSGPMEKFIYPPKVLKFEGGVAYLYTFLKKFYPKVAKKKLSWEISLMTVPQQPAPSADMKVVFDPESRKAKLLVSLKGAGDTLTVEDPAIGDTLYVVPTADPRQVVWDQRKITDFETFPALTGMVIRPFRDGLKTNHTDDILIVSAMNGLTVTSEIVGTPALIGETDEVSDNDNNRLFDFPNWRQGGVRLLQVNKQRLQESVVSAKTPEERAGLLMKMAILYFANNFGQEALGILDMVLQENPEMEKNPDFIAIRGASNAMAGHYKEALQDLSNPVIQQNPEVKMWVGYAAAATEQWRMADRSFPKTNRILLQYPDSIAIPFTIYMAESALHLGRTDTAKKLLGTINMSSDALAPQYRAAIDYLHGETFSQEGKTEDAEKIWRPVAAGINRLYHTKATLSLTQMLLRQKKITVKDAIEGIENLRFAWRGDGLEVEILRQLGALKVQDNQYLSGLEDMKQAAELSDSMLEDSTYIRDKMREIVAGIFSGEEESKIPPLEAVSIYGEFSTLLPSGSKGTTTALNFADYLIRMDLLSKAAELIETQITAGMPEQIIAGTGAKLAAVYLLDNRPEQALDALKKTEKGSLDGKAAEERNLLKARAQSQMGQAASAISTLTGMTSKNALKLKADVFWRAQNWNGAAETLETLLPGPGIPVTEEDAPMIVNAAVAWKLAGKTDHLKDVKSRYEASMAATKLSSTFDVVTRNGGASDLSDRASMLKIAGEADIFKSFLDAYKAGKKGS